MISTPLLHLTNLTAHAEHHGWCDTQLIDPHLDEALRQRRICAELATDADPLARLMRAVDGHLNHPKNRLMMWIIEIVQLLILAIDRKCILREVVGADAEEIDE